MWRRQARAKGLVSDARYEPSAAPALTFTRVRVAEEPAVSDPSEAVRSVRRRKVSRRSARIEIELKSGERVRVEVPADAALVVSIVSSLRGSARRARVASGGCVLCGPGSKTDGH
jgi:hypothetical protein